MAGLRNGQGARIAIRGDCSTVSMPDPAGKYPPGSGVDREIYEEMSEVLRE